MDTMKFGDIDVQVRYIAMPVITVTPEVADYLLDRNYEGQRSVNKSTVEKFARIIADGKWNCRLGAPIQFNPEADGGKGELYDAQHRCLAVKKTRKPVEMLLNTEVSASDFALLDCGKSREKADGLLGADRRNRASFIASVISYELNGYGSSMFDTKDIPNEWVKEWDDQHPGVSVEYCRVGQNIRDNMGSIGSALAFSLFAYLLDKIESDKADVFKAALRGKLVAECEEHLIAIKNVNTMGVRLRRDFEHKRARNASASFIYAVRAWNAFAKGNELGKIQMKLDKNKRTKFIPMELLQQTKL